MARLFFKDVPAEPTCSACGQSDPRYIDIDTEKTFCDYECFVDWFHENEAEKWARLLAEDRLYEIYY